MNAQEMQDRMRALEAELGALRAARGIGGGVVTATTAGNESTVLLLDDGSVMKESLTPEQRAHYERTGYYEKLVDEEVKAAEARAKLEQEQAEAARKQAQEDAENARKAAQAAAGNRATGGSEASSEGNGEDPKWYQAIREANSDAPERQDGETQAAYRERTGL